MVQQLKFKLTAFITLTFFLLLFLSLSSTAVQAIQLLMSFQEPILDHVISLDLDNEDLGKVILMLFRQYGANIIVDSGVDVSAKVTTKLSKVPLKYALDQILRSRGYGYEEIEGGIVRVMPLEKLPAMVSARAIEEPVDTKIFPIKYVDPTTISTIVQQFMTDKGKVVPLPQTRVVAVKDRVGNLEKIGQLIAELDRKLEPESEEERKKEIEAQLLQPLSIPSKTEKRLIKIKYADLEKVRALIAPLLGEHGKMYIIETSK